MNINLKKSLFVSMTALGFFAAGTISHSSVSAKSRVRVTSNSALKTAGSSRNVTFTGSNALYNKAATLKGARKVASTSTLRSIANSGRSSQNVRAYRVAKTNRGLVYYKVVTFDGQHRGWIYGGRSKTSFRGGLKAYSTFKQGTVSSDMQNGTYKLANPGTGTATYVKPAWTQYKVGKKAADTSAYADSVYKIDEAGTRTKEGDQWVHIYAYEGNAGANGWILASQLKAADSSSSSNNGNNSQPTTNKIADNALRINFVDAATGAPVKSMDYIKNGGTKGSTLGTLTNGVWQLGTNDQTALQTQMNATLNALGYYPGALTVDQMASLAQGVLGSSVTISIQKGTKPIVDKAVQIQLTDPNGNLIKNVDYTNATAANGKTLGTANGSSWTLAAADVTAIQDQIVNALKGTGYGLNDDNKLTTDQQTALAQTVFGGQVKIQTVIPKAPEIGDNQVKLTFVDDKGTTIGSIKLTKADGESTVQDTIKTAANGNDPTAGGDISTKAYSALLRKANIKGYGIDGSKLSANSEAILGATYGKEIKLTVTTVQTQSLLTDAKFFDGSHDIGYMENANGKRDTDSNFAQALLKDANINGAVGDTIAYSDFNKAIFSTGLETIYYASKQEGVWPVFVPGTHLDANDLDGTGATIFNAKLNSQKIYVYKLTISATMGGTNVVTGTDVNGKTSLFDKDGNATIGATGTPITLKYSEVEGPHFYDLSKSENFSVTSLAELYAKSQS